MIPNDYYTDHRPHRRARTIRLPEVRQRRTWLRSHAAENVCLLLLSFAGAVLLGNVVVWLAGGR